MRPSSIDSWFHPVGTACQLGTRTLTVQNTAAEAVDIVGITVSPAVFQLDPAPTLPTSTPPGGKSSFIVRFEPTTAGPSTTPFEGTICVTDSRGVSYLVPIHAVGVDDDVIDFDPTTIDFGEVAIGSNDEIPLTISRVPRASGSSSSSELVAGVGSPTGDVTAAFAATFPLVMPPCTATEALLTFTPSTPGAIEGTALHFDITTTTPHGTFAADGAVPIAGVGAPGPADEAGGVADPAAIGANDERTVNIAPGDVDCFSFALASTSAFSFTPSSGVDRCPSTVDTVVTLFAFGSQIAAADDDDGGMTDRNYCGDLVLVLDGGEYVGCVQAFDALDALQGVRVTTSAFSVATPDQHGNREHGTPSGLPIAATIELNPGNDEDCFDHTALADGPLRFETSDGFGGCPAGVDTFLDLYLDGIHRAADDDGGPGVCSELEYLAAAGEHLTVCVRSFDGVVTDDVLPAIASGIRFTAE
jgi:hypothetical protein